jgi:hypothetical protein
MEYLRIFADFEATHEYPMDKIGDVPQNLAARAMIESFRYHNDLNLI